MATARRPWYRFRLRTMLAMILVAVVAWSLYSYWSDYAERSARRARELMSPAVGARCTAILRSGAIGVARSGPRPAEVDGVSNSVRGAFVRMNDSWLVLEGVDAAGAAVRKWIPCDQVLVLQVEMP